MVKCESQNLAIYVGGMEQSSTLANTSDSCPSDKASKRQNQMYNSMHEGEEILSGVGTHARILYS